VKNESMFQMRKSEPTRDKKNYERRETKNGTFLLRLWSAKRILGVPDDSRTGREVENALREVQGNHSWRDSTQGSSLPVMDEKKHRR
jgi:hypothetical protein